MPKEKRIIEKSDLLEPEFIEKYIRQFSKDLVDLKKIEEFHLDLMQHFILSVMKPCLHKFKRCYILKKEATNNLKMN